MTGRDSPSILGSPELKTALNAGELGLLK
jgi:hypothetical protein